MPDADIDDTLRDVAVAVLREHMRDLFLLWAQTGRVFWTKDDAERAVSLLDDHPTAEMIHRASVMRLMNLVRPPRKGSNSSLLLAARLRGVAGSGSVRTRDAVLVMLEAADVLDHRPPLGGIDTAKRLEP